jgi:hypothetical protein
MRKTSTQQALSKPHSLLYQMGAADEWDSCSVMSHDHGKLTAALGPTGCTQPCGCSNTLWDPDPTNCAVTDSCALVYMVQPPSLR